MDNDKKTRVVIMVDKSLRDEVVKLAKSKGRVLSALYVELFKRGHQVLSQEG